jgi:AcrR family transcriptional regulator
MGDQDLDQGGDGVEEGTREERRSRAEKKIQSRRRILDAARDVFFREGFMAANLDEVAERAGVAKGTLYRYFESKADLYVAVLSENGREFTARLEQAALTATTAVERVRRISSFYLEHWTRHRDYFQIFWAIENQAVIGDLPIPVIDEVRRLWEQSLRILNDVLERGVRDGELVECDTWEMANILWIVANSLIQSDATEVRRELLGRSIAPVYSNAIEVVLRGLAVTQPENPA